MPYRIDLPHSPADALDRLVGLGALDIDVVDGRLSAIMPDTVVPAAIGPALGLVRVDVTPAESRDDGSVWVLESRAVQVGRLTIAPCKPDAALAKGQPAPWHLRLIDGPAFGTGRHPTTALCVEAIEACLVHEPPSRLLDVGTGSGILALAALAEGVPEAVGLDTDMAAIHAATANARLNGLATRLHLMCGGPGAVRGAWPLVVANILPATLIDLAPVLVQRVGHGGRLILAGIQETVAPEVERTYRRLGMHISATTARAGWAALTFCPSW